MSQYGTLITRIGLAKIANAQVTQSTVGLEYIALGDGNGAHYVPTQDQTELVNEVWRGPIANLSIDPNNNNRIIADAVIPNTAGGFTIREIGLFDEDNYLIAVGQYPETYKPLLNEGISEELLIHFTIETANADVVKLAIDPTVIIASRSYVDGKVWEVRDDLNAHKAEEVHEGEVHGLRLNEDKKLEYFNGVDWIEIKGGGYPVNIVKNVTSKAGNASVELVWEDPKDVIVDGVTVAEWSHTRVVRKVGGYPIHEDDGEIVISTGERDLFKDNPFVDTGLQNGTTYYYAFFPTTTEDVVTISELSRTKATPTEQPIYGVRIDKSNSNPETRVTYIKDAVGFQPMRGNNGDFSWGSWQLVFRDLEIRPCVLQNGQVQYHLDPNDYSKKEDGSSAVISGADGDVMIEFGKTLWWKWSDEGETYTIEISDREFNGAVKHAFEIEVGYNLVSHYPLLLTQILFVIFFKSTDSRTSLGRGWHGGATEYASTGGTDNKGMFYGSQQSDQVKFLGIEDYWGNKNWWIDGLVTDTNFNILTGKGNFSDSGTEYVTHTTGLSRSVSGYIREVQGGNDLGFIIKSAGGSETTYYTNYADLYSSRYALFGSSRVMGVEGGFAHLRLNDSGLSPHMSARLFCASSGKIYIGAYLGTLTGGRLRSVSGTVEPTGSRTLSAFRKDARANN